MWISEVAFAVVFAVSSYFFIRLFTDMVEYKFSTPAEKKGQKLVGILIGFVFVCGLTGLLLYLGIYGFPKEDTKITVWSRFPLCIMIGSGVMALLTAYSAVAIQNAKPAVDPVPAQSEK